MRICRQSFYFFSVFSKIDYQCKKIDISLRIFLEGTSEKDQNHKIFLPSNVTISNHFFSHKSNLFFLDNYLPHLSETFHSSKLQPQTQTNSPTWGAGSIYNWRWHPCIFQGSWQYCQNKKLTLYTPREISLVYYLECLLWRFDGSLELFNS